MFYNYRDLCNREIVRLNKNVRLILNKKNITNTDLENLNDLYNELDFYNYYTSNQIQRLEDYYDESIL